MNRHPLRPFGSLGLLLLVLAPLVLASGGCGQSSYELRLVPQGESLSRTLLYHDHRQAESEGDAHEPSAEATRLAKVYGGEVPKPVDGRFQYEGTFTGSMPDDIGGSGRFERKQTSLGSLCIYTERFRGSYELAQNLEARFAKVETLAQLLSHWVRTAGKESPLRERAERMIEDELQRDLKDVVVLIIATGETDRVQEAQDLWMQLAQFAAERGYIDLDLVLRGYAGGESEAHTLALLRQAVVLKLQLQDESELLRVWPALATPESFEASLDEVVEATDVYTQEVRRLTQAAGRDEKPSGSEVLAGLLMEILAIKLFPGDSLTVYLHCPHEPLSTNGVWMAEDERVRWEMQLPGREPPVPAFPPDLCYAIWSEPDREYQQQHFGQVLFKGEPLAIYCSWRVSLKKEEAAEWDQFLETLSGGENLEAKVLQFQFSAPEKNQSPAARQIESVKARFQKEEAAEEA
ncbi:hypothetical protein [Candidatus Laterigemmans baculatus]|uniref:hypothetical protein n=1 Tax=Candidatus Laterigemmans baculatus TaxID=2770505 RepID=UPI0013DA646D|nr:hypothetical protein [Candidatus Laterigemmans baculatus]